MQNFGASALQTTLKVGSAIAATPVGYAIGAAVNDAGVAALSALVAPEYAAGSTVGESALSSAGATGAVSDVGASVATAGTAANEVTSAAATVATTSDAATPTQASEAWKAAMRAAGLTPGAAEAAPFTLDQTTMTVANKAAWESDINFNGASDFGRDTLQYANAWATNMEKAMATGQPMSSQLVDQAADEYAPNGVNGLSVAVFMPETPRSRAGNTDRN